MFIILLLSVLFAAGFIVRRLFLKREATQTASGAIVMAFGIFLFGSLDYFPWLMSYGGFLTLGLLGIWLSVAALIAHSVWDHSFRERHLNDPINAFGIGTWVAGTSVLGNLLSRYFGDWTVFLWILVALNTLLWLIYIGMSLRSFRLLFHFPFQNRVHGVVLLSVHNPLLFFTITCL